MHALWFSLLVPVLAGSAWIWPSLRRPKSWLGIGMLLMVATILWLGIDWKIYSADEQASGHVGLRLVYVLLGATGLPVVQLVLGSSLAAGLSMLLLKPISSSELPTTSTDAPKTV